MIPKTYYPQYAYGDSVYKGETWNAFTKGQDENFPSKYVSRGKNGVIHSILNTRKALVENAKMLGVKLIWEGTTERVGS